MSKQYTASEQYQELMEGLHSIPDHGAEELQDLSRELLNKLQSLVFYVG